MDGTNLITDPAHAWFSGNIYHEAFYGSSGPSRPMTATEVVLVAVFVVAFLWFFRRLIVAIFRELWRAAK